MRKVSCLRNKRLQNEQFEVLLDILNSISDRNDLDLFLRSVLSESEAAYLAQRLNIIRMLSKGLSYQQIADKIKVPSGTIAHAQKCFLNGGERMRSIITSYKFKGKEESQIQKVDDNSDSSKLINPRMPGSII